MKQKFEKKRVDVKMAERKMDCRIALFFAVAMCFFGEISEANAQTCIKTPTCAELGYAQSPSDCTGKTILKCPLDISKVYCPSDTESSKIYKVGDIFVDKNGIALGKVVELDGTGQHGVIAFSGGNGTPTEATQYCVSRTVGGLNWGVATGRHSCQIKGADKAGSGCIFYCSIHSSSSFGCCDGASGFTQGNSELNSYYQNCKSTAQLGFFCEANF